MLNLNQCSSQRNSTFSKLNCMWLILNATDLKCILRYCYKILRSYHLWNIKTSMLRLLLLLNFNLLHSHVRVHCCGLLDGFRKSPVVIYRISITLDCYFLFHPCFYNSIFFSFVLKKIKITFWLELWALKHNYQILPGENCKSIIFT